MGLKILLFVPNIIGYIRIFLLLVCWWTFNYPAVFFSCYVIFIILDGLDGYAARQLNQVSEFGAWFDVAIDNFGRTMLWCLLFKWGHFISSLEWCVFVCTHNSMGADWKNKFGEGPWWVRKTMANGFKTPVGVFAIFGLHVLPIWLYGYYNQILSSIFLMPLTMQWLIIAFLVAGRLLCMAVEFWCICIHILYLVRNEKQTKVMD